MLLRMYKQWAHRRGFSCITVETNQKGGQIVIEGKNVFGYLSTEKGTHRLVRISPFNSDGKRMTSFAAVETMPVLKEDETDLKVNIPQKDIQLSFMRAGGAGGQVLPFASHITHVKYIAHDLFSVLFHRMSIK